MRCIKTFWPLELNIPWTVILRECRRTKQADTVSKFNSETRTVT